MKFALSKLARPNPPAHVLDPTGGELFLPAFDVSHWFEETFIVEGAPLQNPDHRHLQMASIGVLWSNVRCDRKMIPVVGMMQLTKPNPMQDEWAKARQRVQLRGWFGFIPDFLMTLYAPYMAAVDNATFCAVIEHELYHAKLKFITSKGVPVWGIYGHDVEEHVGVVDRYGVGAAAGKTHELVEAAKRKPSIAPARVDWACGYGLKGVKLAA